MFTLYSTLFEITERQGQVTGAVLESKEEALSSAAPLSKSNIDDQGKTTGDITCGEEEELLWTWTFENCNQNLRPDLFFTEQTLDSLLAVDLWQSLCPFLSVLNIGNFEYNKREHHVRTELNVPLNYSLLGDLLSSRGYFKLSKEDTSFPSCLSELLAMGVKRIVAHGYSATSILMYDETWLFGDFTKSILEKSSESIKKSIGDWYVFYVNPSSSDVMAKYLPGPPHRDRPLAGSSSFRLSSDDSKPPVPKYVSVWIALTSASCENSCLYLLPRQNDSGYHAEEGGDAMSSVSSEGSNKGEGGGGGFAWLQNIVAQPMSQGGMLSFSHRCLHWGSNPQPNAERPRIALTMAFSEESFEKPYFDHELYGSLPPLGLRLGLLAGQQIQYEHIAPMDKAGASLYRRIFQSQKMFFSETYSEKITSAAQFLIFKISQQKKK